MDAKAEKKSNSDIGTSTAALGANFEAAFKADLKSVQEKYVEIQSQLKAAKENNSAQAVDFQKEQRIAPIWPLILGQTRLLQSGLDNAKSIPILVFLISSPVILAS